MPTSEFGTTILEPGEEVGGGVKHSPSEVGGSCKILVELEVARKPETTVAQRAGGIHHSLVFN